MSSPPTLVLPDDDERTIVASNLPEERRPLVPVDTGTSQKSLRDPHSPRSTWPSPLSLCFLAASFVILVVAANQQRRRHARLLQTIQALQREDRMPFEAGGAATVGAIATSPDSVFEAARELSNEPAERRADLELEAVGFLLANDFGSALESYRRLSRRFPDEPAFGDVVRVLRRKLGCSVRDSTPGSTCE